MSDQQAPPDGNMYFVWDRKAGVRPATREEWARWFSVGRLALDVIEGCRVSTAFLGMDQRVVGDGPPLIWETLVFSGPLDGEQGRYATEEEARAGHAAMVARVRAAPRG